MPDLILEALNLLVPAGVIRGGMSIDGRQLRWVETVSGEPTVILEAGRNDFSLSWTRVIARLSQAQVHVVAYDRAGIGFSEPAPGEGILRRQVSDLAAIIQRTAQRSCLLVGHSWGGVLAELLAFEHPNLVSGLVLVDPAHEQMTSTLPAFIQGMIRAFPARLQPVLSAFGIVRLIQSRVARQNAQRFTEDRHIRDAVIRAYRSCAGRPDELLGAALDSSLLQQLRTESHPFPDIPVVILSASQGFPHRVREHWTALQANLAATASQGKHIVVADVDHAIPQKRPDRVVDAIFEVVGK